LDESRYLAKAMSLIMSTYENKQGPMKTMVLDNTQAIVDINLVNLLVEESFSSEEEQKALETTMPALLIAPEEQVGDYWGGIDGMNTLGLALMKYRRELLKMTPFTSQFQ